MSDEERNKWYVRKDKQTENTYHGLHRIEKSPEETRLTHTEIQKRKSMFYRAK